MLFFSSFSVLILRNVLIVFNFTDYKLAYLYINNNVIASSLVQYPNAFLGRVISPRLKATGYPLAEVFADIVPFAIHDTRYTIHGLWFEVGR